MKRFILFLLTCVCLKAGSVTATNLYPAYVDQPPHTSGTVTFTYSITDNVITIVKSSGSTFNPGVSNWNSNSFIIVTFDGGGSSGFGVSQNEYPGSVVCPAGRGATILIGNETTVLFSFHVDLATAPQPQTLIVSPSTAASGVKGESFAFTLTGAQSSNTYAASVVSGNVSLSISGNILTVFTSQTSEGLGVVNAYITGGNGYIASDGVDIHIALGASKKVRFSIPANKGDYPITYKAFQGGIEIGSLVKNPGDGAIIFEIDVAANGGEVTLKQFVTGVGVDGSSLVNQSGTTSQVGTTAKQTPSTEPTLSPVAAGDGVVILNPANNTSKASVWELPATNAAPATDSTIRQGFDKLVGTDAALPNVIDDSISIADSDKTNATQAAGDSLATSRNGYNSRLSEVQNSKPVLPTVNTEIHRYEINCLPHNIGPIVLDFSNFSTSISIMRTIIKFGLIFMAWFAYAKTLKSSIV